MKGWQTPTPSSIRNPSKMKKLSKIIQLLLHGVVIVMDIIFILLLDNPEFGLGKIAVGFLACTLATIGTVNFPAVKAMYKSKEGLEDIDPIENETERNQKKSDEISDETIMKVLNAIGYEEESWIPVVREHLRKIESEPEN